MAHFWITRFTTTAHKMTFLVRHRMKQSNPKLTKHEGTHLSLEKYCNLRGDQAWDNGNLNLDLLISKSPFFAVCDHKPSSQHGDVCLECKRKPHCLFVFLSFHRGTSNTECYSDLTWLPLVFCLSNTHLHAIPLILTLISWFTSVIKHQ